MAWDGQGNHRTGTVGGKAGAAWLTREAAALGGTVTLEEFALDRLDPVAAFLEIGAERIEAFPVFDAPATDAIYIPQVASQQLIEYTRLKHGSGYGWISVEGLVRDAMPPLEDLILGGSPAPIGTGPGLTA